MSRSIPELPFALDHLDDVRRRLGAAPAVFLDYDGVLTPIVERPEEAVLSDRTRSAVHDLSRTITVAVVSGRDLDDVRAMVGLDHLTYAGSHGFDILHADGRRDQRGQEYLPALEEAEERLMQPLASIAGARLERKGFAIAVHYRQVADSDVPSVERVVDEVAASIPQLRRTGGKKIFELRPDLEWDKGRAVLHLMEVLGLGDDVVPVYLGDDETDEDAFRAIAERGIGLVVGDEDRPTLASYRLRDTSDVDAILEALASRRRAD
jgi:trehalose-phosphatase